VLIRRHPRPSRPIDLFCATSAGARKRPAAPGRSGAEKRNGDFVRRLIQEGRTDTVHGLLRWRSCWRRWRKWPWPAIWRLVRAYLLAMPSHRFRRRPGRYVLACPAASADALLAAAAKADVPAMRLGRDRRKGVDHRGAWGHILGRRCQAHEGWLPRYMEAQNNAPIQGFQ